MILSSEPNLFPPMHIFEFGNCGKVWKIWHMREQCMAQVVKFSHTIIAPVHCLDRIILSSCSNGVIYCLHSRWNSPTSWRNIRHWLYFPSEDHRGILYFFSKNYRFQFVGWQIHVGLLWRKFHGKLFWHLLGLRSMFLLRFWIGAKTRANYNWTTTNIPLSLW